jgi:PKD repeat protein
MSILAKGFHSACLGLCAIAVFFLLMGTPAEVSAQQARGLFFAVFGQDAPPERGDHNHVQTIYIDIPITETRPIYLRIFDADVGGNLDERHGNFNSKTRFVLLGGNSAARTFEVRPDIRRSPYVNHNFPTEDIIHDRTFGVERSADGRYSVLGNLPPNRGYLTPDGYRRYVFLTMGIEGNDGNFFDFVISYDPNDKVEPANYRMFAYELTFRMPALRSFEGQIRIPVQDRQRIQVATFGLNGERAAIAIPSQELYDIPSSTSDSWSIVPVDIANPSLISSIGFNFYGTTYTNVFSFMALDEEGKPIAIPLPIPDYEPVSEPVLRVTQSYAPDDCHVVHLERLIINGDNFLNPETEWQFASDTLRGDRLERRFDEKGYHPFTLQVSGTLNGNQSFFAVRDSVFINTPPSAWAGGNRAFVVGRPMAFDGTVSEDPDGRISRYFWDFGDGNTAMGARVDHTFNRAGTYTVTLRVLDDSNSPCNEATATAIVSVNRPPIARISAPAFAEPGETVVLDGSASEDPDGEITEYQWVIGADSVRYGPLVEFIAWQARSIPITLTVIDNSFSQNSTGTARHTIGMSTRPIARAGNDKHVSPNRPATFVGTSSSAESGRIVRYEWIFPGNIIVEGATVQQGIADPGDHYVYLRVTDSNGGTDIDSLYVRVNFPPVPVITGNRILTDGRAVLSARDSFDPDGEIIRYEWNMGDGRRITGPDATHTYRRPGRYTVTLNIADNSGTFSSRQSITTEVIVNQLPIARINAPGSGTAGQTLSFDGSASADPDGSIIRHIWDFGDGNAAEGALVSHTYDNPGVYQTKLTVFDDTDVPESAGFVYHEITIEGIPELIALHSEIIEAAETEAIETESAESEAAVEADLSASSDIEASNSTELTFSLQLPEVVCAGSPFALSIQDFNSSEGARMKVRWDFGDGFTAEGASVVHSYALPGIYTATATMMCDPVANCEEVVSDYREITVLPAARALFETPEVLAFGAEILLDARLSQTTGHQIKRIRWDIGTTQTLKWTMNTTGTDAGAWQLTAPAGMLASGQTLTSAAGKLPVVRAMLPAGTHIVRLSIETISEAACTTATQTRTIQVSERPEVVIVRVPVLATGAPHNFQINGDASALRDPVWDFAGVRVSGSAVAHAFPQPGTYEVRFLASGPAADGTMVESELSRTSVRVNYPPQAIIDGPAVVNRGDTVTFSGRNSFDEDGEIRQFDWFFGSTRGGNAAEINHVFESAGTQTVTLVVYDNDQLSNSRHSVTREVMVLDTRRIESTLSDMVCVADTLNLPALLSISSDQFSELQLRLNGQQVSFVAASAYTFAQRGSYMLDVMNSSGESLFRQEIIAHEAPPIAARVPTQIQLGGADDSALFDASEILALNGAGVRVYWDFGDGTTASGQTVRYTYRRPGTYSVTVTSVSPFDLPCNTSSQTYTVRVTRD